MFCGAKYEPRAVALSRRAQSSVPAGGGLGHARRRHVRRACRARSVLGRRIARSAEAEARRKRRDCRQELARLSRIALWHLARRPCRCSRQCQAAWRRARLHSRAIGRARVLRLQGSRRRHRTACAEKSRTPDRHRQRRLRGAVLRRSDRDGAARGRRSRLAVLHVRHDRAAKGCHAHARQSDRGKSRLWQRGRSGDAGRSPSCTPRR